MLKKTVVKIQFFLPNQYQVPLCKGNTMKINSMSVADLVCVMTIFAILVATDAAPLIDTCWRGKSNIPIVSRSNTTHLTVDKGSCRTSEEPIREIVTNNFVTITTSTTICIFNKHTTHCECSLNRLHRRMLGSHMNINDNSFVVLSSLPGFIVASDLHTGTDLQLYAVPVNNYFAAEMNTNTLTLFIKDETTQALELTPNGVSQQSGYSCKSYWDGGPERGVSTQQETSSYHHELLLKFTTPSVRLRRDLVKDMSQVVSLVANAVHGTAACIGLCDMTQTGDIWVIRNCYDCAGAAWTPSSGISILSKQYYSYQISVDTALLLDEVLKILNADQFKMIFSTWGTLELVVSSSADSMTDTLQDIKTRTINHDTTDKIIGIVITVTSGAIFIAVGIWCYITRTDDYVLNGEKQDPEKTVAEDLQPNHDKEADSLTKETTTTKPSESFFINNVDDDDDIFELGNHDDDDDEEIPQSI